jgi:hypothetical protein
MPKHASLFVNNDEKSFITLTASSIHIFLSNIIQSYIIVWNKHSSLLLPERERVKRKKSFIVSRPEANVIKLFCPYFTNFRTKIPRLFD